VVERHGRRRAVPGAGSTGSATGVGHRGDRALRKIAEAGVPTLIVHGTADRILPVDATGREFAKRLPAARYAHLLAGDESALPAIAAALAEIPPDVVAHALVEVADEAEEQPLSTPGELRLRWVHRSVAGQDGLVDAVRALEFPPGRVRAGGFRHERGGCQALVRLLSG
jgi:Siderophore-interacting protein